MKIISIPCALLLGVICASFLQDSPPSPEALGRAGWIVLHMVTVTYPETPSEDQKHTMNQFFYSFAQVYPCETCSQHFQTELQKEPPHVNNREELVQWLCRVHNRVNDRLGKPQFDCTTVLKRWDPRAQPPRPCPCAKKHYYGQKIDTTATTKTS